MELPDNSNDETDGLPDLTLHPDTGKTCRYTVDKQLTVLFSSFLNERYKDDVAFVDDENNEDVDERNLIRPNITYEYIENETKKFQFIIVASRDAPHSITSEDLLDQTSGKYNLKQYFRLYWSLRLQKNYSGHPLQIVVWTNATFDVEELNRQEVTLRDYEGRIYVPGDHNQKQKAVYQIDGLPDDTVHQLEDNFTKEFAEEQQQGTEASVSENPVKDFCDALIFYVALKDRFLNALSIIGIKTTNPEKKLDHGDFFAQTSEMQHLEWLINSDLDVLHFVSDSTSLAFIKVAQILKNEASIVTYSAVELDYLMSFNEEIKAVLEMVERFVLLVEIPKDTPTGELETKAKEVVNSVTLLCKCKCESCKSQNYQCENCENCTCENCECKDTRGQRKTIFVYHSQNKDVVNSWISNEALRSNSENTTVMSFNFDQLSPEAQTRVQKAGVKFQGQDVPLQELLSTEVEPEYNKLLTQNVLEKQISGGPLVVGNSLPGLTPEVRDCYIRREYEHCSQISARSIVDNFKGYGMKLGNNEHSNALGKSRKNGLDTSHVLHTIDGLLSLNLEVARKHSRRGKSLQENNKTKLSINLQPPATSHPKVKTKVFSIEPKLFAEKSKRKKEASSGNWNIEIRLNDHVDTLNEQAMDTEDDLIEFLVVATKQSTGDVQEGLRTGQKSMMVFLDASGDSWKKVKDKAVAMLELMKSTRIQELWVNTGGKGKKLFCRGPSAPVFNLTEDCPKGNAAPMFTWENPDEDSIIGNIEASKLVVISGDPGAGKSVALGNIAIKIKERYPDYWVIQIGLGDHVDFLRSNMKVAKPIDTSVIEFLSAAEGFAEESTNLTRAILKRRVMNTGKIVVLLDAFDEICPLYKNQVLNMIEWMNTSKIGQIWISTRPEFQTAFRTEHSYSLKDFNTDEQECFVEKYLDHLLKLKLADAGSHETFSDSSQSVETYCADLHRKIRSTSDSTMLIGNALLARMAVEIYVNEINESCQSSMLFHASDVNSNISANNLSKLYEQFIKQRYCFHCQGKWKAKTSSAILNMENKSALFSTAYQRYAFQFLFNDKFKLFYVPKDELAQLMAWDLVAIGLISERSKKFQFFHRTFAEYYVAQFMAKMLMSRDLNIWKNVKTLKAKRKIEFLSFEHFKERNKMIRNFMDHFLARGSDVHEAVLNDNFEEFLKVIHKDERMARSRDKLGRTPLHLACSYKRKNVADYLLSLDAFLITDLDVLGFGPMCYAAVRGDEFFMKNMLKAGAKCNNGTTEHLRHVVRVYNLY